MTTPVDALIPAVVEQYGAGAVMLVILYRRIARVEDAVDELREHVDDNAARLRYESRDYPRSERDAAEVSTTRPNDD